jgi:predicted O-methyltransferase YrrM
MQLLRREGRLKFLILAVLGTLAFFGLEEFIQRHVPGLRRLLWQTRPARNHWDPSVFYRTWPSLGLSTLLLKKTADPADAVLHEIEEMGKRSFIPSIGPVKGRILAEVVRVHKPRKILEIGSLYGYSAIIIAKNSPAGAEITTVEKNPEHARITEQNVERAELENQIKIIQGDAKEILPKLPGPFDLVFLDAEKSEYLECLRMIENKLHQGTVVVADNVGVFKDQMIGYLNYVRNTGRYRSRTVDTLLEFSDTTKDAMEISEKRY